MVRPNRREARLLLRLAQGCALVFALSLAYAANALNLGSASASFDGVFYVSAYPNGDKPQVVCNTPSSWTVATKDDGFGEICEQSATEFDLVVGGTSAANGFRYAYQNVASGDFQLKLRVTDVYTPTTLGAFAGVGITISDGTGTSDAVHNVFSPLSSSAVARSLAGVPGATTNTNGAAGQSRPRYLCATYDESATESRVFESADGSTWLPVATFDYAFLTPIVGFYGQSGSASETLSATVDNVDLATGTSSIDCYTPDPPPPAAPTLVTPISNQSGTSGTAFTTLSCAANWTGETSYTISGLAASTGLSFNTSTCSLSGTPNANDVGTRTVTISGVNASGSTPSAFSLTIASPPSGNILTIPVNGGAYQIIDCDTFESGGRVDPGDILQLDGGGAYGPMTIQDCQGSADDPIVIRNDPNDAAAATITRSTTGKSFVLELKNSDYIQLTGAGKWSGAPAGECGVTVSGGVHTESTNTCGIILTKTGGVSQPVYYLRINGTSCTPECTVDHIKIDALANAGGTGICYSINDHTVLWADFGVWREDITISHNVGEFCGAEGEGMYIGPNDNAGDLPLRNVHIDNNLLTDSGRECVNVKSVWSGNNSLNYNHCYRPGLPQTGTQDDGFNIMGTSSWEVIGNKIEGAGGACIHLQYDTNGDGFDTATPVSTYTIESNYLIDCGQNNDNDDYGIDSQLAGSSVSLPTVSARGNTIVSNADGPINMTGVFVGRCSAANNIYAGNGNGNAAINCLGVGNVAGTTASFQFVNEALSGGDFHLTSGSTSVCGQGTSAVPATDYDGQTRPLETTYEVGADETTSCP